VAVVGGVHVAQPRGQRAPLHRAVGACYCLRRGEDGLPVRPAAGFDDQRAGTDVVGRRAEAEPEPPPAVVLHGAHGELPGRLRGEVGQERTRSTGGGAGLGGPHGRGTAEHSHTAASAPRAPNALGCMGRP